MSKISAVATQDMVMNLFTLKIGSWTFKPGFMSSLITLLILPLFVYLGFWQWSRYEEKNKLKVDYENRFNALPLLLSPKDIEENFQTYKFHTLQITGRFLNEHQVLLDNQILKGQVGYLVLTPFKPNNSHSWILIDRGFIPIEKNRDTFPNLSPIRGEVTLTGIIYKPIQGIQLKQIVEKKESWDINYLRAQTINYEQLSTLFKQPLNTFVLKLNQNSKQIFTFVPLSFGLPANRHLGYSVQWFTMALAVLIYYCVINLRHDEKK